MTILTFLKATVVAYHIRYIVHNVCEQIFVKCYQPFAVKMSLLTHGNSTPWLRRLAAKQMTIS